MEAIIEEKISLWLNSEAIDAQTKEQVKALRENETEAIEAFYKDLEFGTGGLRGIMGAGSNRMNRYTIGKATQGMCNYLKKCYPAIPIEVAIAHDSRNNSDHFARVTAGVFAANDIKVHLFPELRPTPQLSFAIRELGCQAGIVITASHNPKEYNGYKAYWRDGAQLVPPHDKNVIAEVNKITDFNQVHFDGPEELILPISTELDQKYLDAIKNLVVNPAVIQQQSDLKVVFSSIHGTGITMVPQILSQLGFQNLTIVQEQAEPDGNFPTVVYPNPEEEEAMTMALNKAREINADLIMATDPDTDRVGIGARNHRGEYQLLNGNQTGVLLFHYLLDQWKAKGQLTPENYIVKTIVTTDLIDTIAAGYGVDCFNTLTGFKWIAKMIGELEGSRQFIAGGEESYGYMIGEQVRDKDAVASCAIIAELTAYNKNQGLSLFDRLIKIYQEFGYYKESLISITKPGKSGAEAIQNIMKRFRESPPSGFGGSEVIKTWDYSSSTSRDLKSGETSHLDLPQSNVLQFVTENGDKISVRPSGTEPKIKFYISVCGDLDAPEEFDAITAKLEQKIASIKDDLQEFTK